MTNLVYCASTKIVVSGNDKNLIQAAMPDENAELERQKRKRAELEKILRSKRNKIELPLVMRPAKKM
jgi:hypothetical protein